MKMANMPASSRLLISLISCVFALAVLGLGFNVDRAWASAADISNFTGIVKVSMSNQGETRGYADLVADWSKADSKGGISDAKSSRKSVAAVKVDGNGKQLIVMLKKPGVTKVAYKYNGKSYAVTLKVYKYANPAKRFTIGKKSYTDAFGDGRNYSGYGSGFSGKVSVKATRGWTLDSISVGLNDGGTKAVKNGYVIKKGSAYAMWATFVNKKTGMLEHLTVNP